AASRASSIRLNRVTTSHINPTASRIRAAPRPIDRRSWSASMVRLRCDSGWVGARRQTECTEGGVVLAELVFEPVANQRCRVGQLELFQYPGLVRADRL